MLNLSKCFLRIHDLIYTYVYPNMDTPRHCQLRAALWLEIRRVGQILAEQLVRKGSVSTLSSSLRYI